MIAALRRWQYRRHVQKEKRSPHWSTFRAAFLAEHPACEACGGKVHVEAHHVKPFHLFPAEELEKSNLIALCLAKHLCHLKLGHGGDYHAYVPDVRDLAKHVLARPSSRQATETLAKATRKEAA